MPAASISDTMTTVTSITGTRTRATSLSLTLSLSLHTQHIKSTLETLPTEILLRIATIASSTPRPTHWSHVAHGYKLGGHSKISPESSSDEDEDAEDELEYRASDRSCLCALALTSRTVSTIAHAVLYHTVQLNEVRPLELFARTTQATHTMHRLQDREDASTLVDLNSGKRTMRLVLDLPAFDPYLSTSSRPTSRDRRMLEQQTRLYAAAASVLGLTHTSSALKPSAFFSSLRTLVVPSDVLYQVMRTIPIRTCEERGPATSSPTPSELILDTYIPLSSASSVSGHLSPPLLQNLLLARLGSAITHLTIAARPKIWCLPSDTLTALGGTPALTHLALVRRANANGDNDLEFITDIRQMLEERAGTLQCVVIAVSSDSTLRRREVEQRRGKEATTTGDNNNDELEINAELDPHSILDPPLRALEDYLATTDIWKSLSALARDYPFSKYVVRPNVHVIPSQGDTWARATGRRSGEAAHARNIYLDTPKTRNATNNGDFWTWSRRYDEGRRAREAHAASVMQTD